MGGRKKNSAPNFFSSSNPPRRGAFFPSLSKQDAVLPAYDRIAAEHVVPGIRHLLTTLSAELDTIEADAAAAAAAGSITYETLVPQLEALTDRLGRAWGAVQHLKGACVWVVND